ncbi:uncharacterized protein LOC110836299 isoform X2 [Zootermopsis nevadensis]|uniref:uncharacterized protein LOC110836299 isoform X2 n=1 Tax=Zootermopsis nevadensis TaxID=136037 RepID=UPI000B8ECAE1|nr:uncharacterized protein LOC110836299 isoform X2 [Zootermopsis nevadensis]
MVKAVYCDYPHNKMSYTKVPLGSHSCQYIPSRDITEDQEIQIFVKQLLINRVFQGYYEERRFVESLSSYRGVVLISTLEYDLKKDLDTVIKRLKKFYKFSKVWVGITGPDFIGAPLQHALWIKLQSLTFGYYWFQIRRVKFVENREMILHLKCLSCDYPHNKMSYTKVPLGSHSCQYIPSRDITEDQEIQIFVKQLLINRVFQGYYEERRFVESLSSYRDVVLISTLEYDLKKDLDTVIKRLEKFYKFSKVWVGITGPDFIGAPLQHALWVKLQNLAFGHYWFQIRRVKFVEGREMIIHLNCLRHIDVGSRNVKMSESETVENAFQGAPQPVPANNYNSVMNDKIKQNFRDIKEEITANVASVVTLHNIKGAVCFMSVFIAACITGFFHIIGYVGDYTIKFMREFSIFIQASTPIFLAMIDFFSKCVGGFYLLIAMLWRGSHVNVPRYTDWRPQRRALQMPPNKEFGKMK